MMSWARQPANGFGLSQFGPSLASYVSNGCVQYERSKDTMWLPVNPFNYRQLSHVYQIHSLLIRECIPKTDTTVAKPLIICSTMNLLLLTIVALFGSACPFTVFFGRERNGICEKEHSIIYNSLDGNDIFPASVYDGTGGEGIDQITAKCVWKYGYRCANDLVC